MRAPFQSGPPSDFGGHVFAISPKFPQPGRRRQARSQARLVADPLHSSPPQGRSAFAIAILVCDPPRSPHSPHPLTPRCDPGALPHSPSRGAGAPGRCSLEPCRATANNFSCLSDAPGCILGSHHASAPALLAPGPLADHAHGPARGLKPYPLTGPGTLRIPCSPAEPGTLSTH